MAASDAAITLHGPKATTFGHRVDFAGRLSPKVDDATIRLYRGSVFIAATTLRDDGTYRFNVSLGRPGPFHVVWGRAVSKPILVRIIPKLTASLDGERLAGRPLALRATLEPAWAGSLRVRVVRGGRETYRDGFAGRAHVRLGTADIEAFHVVADVVPATGYARVSRNIRVSLRAPELEYGDTDPLVAGLVRRLTSLGYAAPPVTTTFDDQVLQSVYAFQKAQRLERTGVADARFWRRLASPQTVVPRFASPASHIEIDKGRQILIVVRERAGGVHLARVHRRRPLHTRRSLRDRPEDPRLRPEPARRPLQADVLLRRLRDPRQPVGAALPRVAWLCTRAELRRRPASSQVSPTARQ